MHDSRTSAFSLVELSIVLVILGLLVGGILAGQSLIHAAELRSVSAELTRFNTAVTAFKDKYFAMPGDMQNATSFWGTAAGNGFDAACRDTSTGTMATCNGNGNGGIDNTTEYYRFWQQLSNAGLLEQGFLGTSVFPLPVGYGQNDVPGVNVPASRYPGMAYSANTSDETYNWGTGGNFFKMAKCCHTVTGGIDPPVMDSIDAWNLDTKIDDGIPRSGRLRSHGPGGYASTCTTNAATGNSYQLTANAGCQMRSRMPI